MDSYYKVAKNILSIVTLPISFSVQLPVTYSVMCPIVCGPTQDNEVMTHEGGETWLVEILQGSFDTLL